MQHLYRTDRAGRQNHFARRASLKNLAIPVKQDAGRTALLENETIDEHVFLKSQIGALQGGSQKAARRRPTPAALLIDMEIAGAFVVAGVEIRNFPNAHLLGGVTDRIENGP